MSLSILEGHHVVAGLGFPSSSGLNNAPFAQTLFQSPAPPCGCGEWHCPGQRCAGTSSRSRSQSLGRHPLDPPRHVCVALWCVFRMDVRPAHSRRHRNRREGAGEEGTSCGTSSGWHSHLPRGPAGLHQEAGLKPLLSSATSCLGRGGRADSRVKHEGPGGKPIHRQATRGPGPSTAGGASGSCPGLAQEGRGLP